MVRDTMLDSKVVREETTQGLSIGTMTFDLEWPWTILTQGHMSLLSNVSDTVLDTTLDTKEVG